MPAHGAAAAPIRVNAVRLTSRALCTLCAQETDSKDRSQYSNFGLTRKFVVRWQVFIDLINFLDSGIVDTKVLKSYLFTVMTKWASSAMQSGRHGQPRA